MTLQTYAKLLSELSEVPVLYMDEDNRLIWQYNEEYGLDEMPEGLWGTLQKLLEKLRGGDIYACQYLKDTLPVLMIGIRCPEQGGFLIVGAFCLQTLSFKEQNELCKLCGEHSFERFVYQGTCRKVWNEIRCFLQFLYHMDVEESTLFRREDAEHGEAETKERKKSKIFMEEEEENHIYRDEQIIITKMKNGDVDFVREALTYRFPAYPRLIGSDLYQTEEYVTVSLVAILARAAIEGGASSAESFRLSDKFLKKVSKCGKIEELMDLRIEVGVAMTELCRKCRSRNRDNYYVAQCKKYVAQNYRERISLKQVARELGIGEAYLSHLFKTSEGVTVVAYIQKEKIQAAQNLLKFSDYGIGEIAAYLNFGSPSYFSKLFKKYTYLIPEQYRREYGASKF